MFDFELLYHIPVYLEPKPVYQYWMVEHLVMILVVVFFFLSSKTLTFYSAVNELKIKKRQSEKLLLTRPIIWFDHFSEPYESKPVLNAALTVVRGHSAPMDLVRVETKSEVCFFSFHSVSFFPENSEIKLENKSIYPQNYSLRNVSRFVIMKV